ncbi:MAG: tRNA lysidine(34) synthetase TilS [Roseibium sp.]
MNANVPNAPELPVGPKELSTDEIDQLFAPLKSFSRLALAVSGGADSICLLLLFNDWHSRSGWIGKCEVLTVDHGLRPESAQEAAFVQELSTRFGYTSEKLTWSGEKPSTGVQETARQVRYRLFAKQMSVSNSEILVLAHHKNDQAETFLDRLTRGSGVFGLSAMSADERNGPEGLRLMRPLLDVPKARLKDTLKAREQNWCDDPSNEDHKYKRSRLRNIAGLLEDEGLSQDRIATTVRQMRRMRTALEFVLVETFKRLVEEHPAGPARLAVNSFQTLPEEIRLRLLIMAIERVTGGAVSPRLKKLETLDQIILSAQKVRQTFGGAVLERDDSLLWIWKEAGRCSPKTLVDVSGKGTWDNRFLYEATLPDTGSNEMGTITLGPLKDSPIIRRKLGVVEGWPKDAFSCSPVFWINDKVVSTEVFSSLKYAGEQIESPVVKLTRIPFLPDLAGNYSNDLVTETKV